MEKCFNFQIFNLVPMAIKHLPQTCDIICHAPRFDTSTHVIEPIYLHALQIFRRVASIKSLEHQRRREKSRFAVSIVRKGYIKTQSRGVHIGTFLGSQTVNKGFREKGVKRCIFQVPSRCLAVAPWPRALCSRSARTFWGKRVSPGRSRHETGMAFSGRWTPRRAAPRRGPALEPEPAPVKTSVLPTCCVAMLC